MNRLGLAVLAAVLSALLVAAPALAAVAAPTASVTISTYTKKVSFYVPVVDENVSIPANATKAFNVTLPQWKPSDVEAVIVVVKTDAKLGLAAKDVNGSVLATADVVPLGTAYTVTLPPTTTTVELSAPPEEAANATIQVYLQSNDAEFELTPETNSVTLTAGQAAYVAFTVKQLSGPSVFVYFNTVYPSSVEGFTASMLHSDKSSSYEGTAGGVWTSGSGWTDTAYLRLYWDGSGQETNVNVEVILYADPDGPDGPATPMAVAQVNLSMPASPAAAADVAAHLKSIDAKWLGIGVIFLLFLFLLAAGGKHGRRGTAAPGGVLLLLFLLAVLALAAGFFNLHADVGSIDWKAVGIGVVALLLFLMLAKPHAVRKVASRIGL